MNLLLHSDRWLARILRGAREEGPSPQSSPPKGAREEAPSPRPSPPKGAREEVAAAQPGCAVSRLAGLLVLVAIGVGTAAGDAIPEQQAARIWEAAPDQPQAIPSEPRRVLIFVTPPHLMEKDPLDAVQFVTGDLDGPVAPRAERPVRYIPGTEPVPDLPGFVSLFNGRDLAGWEGDPRIWSVRDGILTGQTTEDVRVTENSFLVWKDEIEDFELRLKFRLEGGNSGIYYRARKRPANRQDGEALVGTQADFSTDGRWTGVIMEYTLREILAERGEQVVIDESGVRRVVGRLGDPTELLAAVDLAQWNEYVVVARGGRVTIAINGVPMAKLDDRDPNRIERGWLGLQVHTGPPMKVEFKDIFLKRLSVVRSRRGIGSGRESPTLHPSVNQFMLRKLPRF
jgi:hypothetical protein